ncbi:MAG: aldehyde dehydrogenase family protein [Roseiarcus sp.]|uniref:aldehyde dehydrogenase family protein n=1 Tax=Roseiarcus sp. TaxID=1969460 RepID=UPI003C540F66
MDRAVKSSHAALESYDLSSLATPFGGFKRSGFGRDRSPHPIDNYMDFKTVWTHYR